MNKYVSSAAIAIFLGYSFAQQVSASCREQDDVIHGTWEYLDGQAPPCGCVYFEENPRPNTSHYDTCFPTDFTPVSDLFPCTPSNIGRRCTSYGANRDYLTTSCNPDYGVPGARCFLGLLPPPPDDDGIDLDNSAPVKKTLKPVPAKRLNPQP